MRTERRKERKEGKEGSREGINRVRKFEGFYLGVYLTIVAGKKWRGEIVLLFHFFCFI